MKIEAHRSGMGFKKCFARCVGVRKGPTYLEDKAIDWTHAGFYVNKSNDEGEKLKGVWGICPKLDVLQFLWTAR